jgi:hypothetical protein
MIHRVLVTLAVTFQPALLAAGPAAAAPQDPVAPAPAPQKPAQALPPGEIKVLQAVILKVEGTRAEWQPKPGEAWRAAKVDDLLDPGAWIRTGPKSRITLRVGMNATVLVDVQTRVELPEIVQDGAVLRTRVTQPFGKTDVKLDRLDLANDFEISTPSAAISVKGTGWRTIWNGVDGFEAYGIPTNALRAIEVEYASRLRVYLTSSDATTQRIPIPAFEAYARTYLLPIAGAVSPEEIAYLDRYPGRLPDILRETGIDALHAARGLDRTIEEICERQGPNTEGRCDSSSDGPGGTPRDR